MPPEDLLRALLLQVLYTIRSERLLMEQLVWTPTTFNAQPPSNLLATQARRYLLDPFQGR